MKKLFIFFSFINILFAAEHLSFSVGQSFHALTYDDGTELSLKSTYSFGMELSVDLGENFEAGLGLESITLSSIEGVDLQTNDRLFPAYLRLEAKGKDNEIFVPYFFGTYGKLVTDLKYTKGTKTTTANDGIVTVLGIGAKIQNNFKVEIYDGTFTNTFDTIDGLVKSTKNASNKVLGIKMAYNLR